MTIDITPLELVPLGRLEVVLDPPVLVLGGPSGTRAVYSVSSGTFEGRGISATVTGEDWVTVGAEGTGTLDVRLVLQTDDGASILVTYQGRTDTTTPGASIYTAPRFETSDERYVWLNRIQAVAKGQLVESDLAYDLFELR